MSGYVPDHEVHRQRHADCPRNERGEDALHVECDEHDCWALRNPQTIDELHAALNHWSDHCYLAGCSHGC